MYGIIFFLKTELEENCGFIREVTETRFPI